MTLFPSLNDADRAVETISHAITSADDGVESTIGRFLREQVGDERPIEGVITRCRRSGP